jgi:hypothetical protein
LPEERTQECLSGPLVAQLPGGPHLSFLGSSFFSWLNAPMRTFTFLLLAAGAALGQTMVDRTFLMRAETTTVDKLTGTTHVCVLVYPDGKYHLEKGFQSNESSTMETHVYLDQLPEASLKQLETTLDDSDFQGINAPTPQGSVPPDLDQLAVAVPREHAIQSLRFDTASQRKPYERGVKPLLDWIKDVQKRKTPVAKDEHSNNCEAPQVMYRIITPHSSDKDVPNQR